MKSSRQVFASVDDTTNSVTADQHDLRARCEALFQEHHRALVRTLYRRLRCWDEAKDVAQEAFLRVFQLGDPPIIDFLRAYVFRVALNLAHDRHIQRQRRKQREALVYAEVYSGLEANNVTPERQSLDEESLQILRTSVATLPLKTRVGFTLVELEGQTVDDAAQILGVSKTAVYQMVYRAYARMARNYAERTGQVHTQESEGGGPKKFNHYRVSPVKTPSISWPRDHSIS